MNPRFPHKVVISRLKLDSNGNDILDPNGDPIPPVVVLECECGHRIYDRDVDIHAELIEANFKLAIPYNDVTIRKKDKIAFTNNHTKEVVNGEVKSFRSTNYGSNIWFQSNE